MTSMKLYYHDLPARTLKRLDLPPLSLGVCVAGIDELATYPRAIKGLRLYNIEDARARSARGADKGARAKDASRTNSRADIDAEVLVSIFFTRDVLLLNEGAFRFSLGGLGVLLGGGLWLPSRQGIFYENGSSEASFNEAGLVEIDAPTPLISRTIEEIGRYLTTSFYTFAPLPFALAHSSFTQRVLSYLPSIPYGKTLSYGKLADAIGHRGAARAVGTSCSKNPLALLLPCHRVVASSRLGGYNGGIEIKRALLKMEGSF